MPKSIPKSAQRFQERQNLESFAVDVRASGYDTVADEISGKAENLAAREDGARLNEHVAGIVAEGRMEGENPVRVVSEAGRKERFG